MATTHNLQGIPLARDVALAIRAKIKEVTGLNASAGISYNKFLAKLASDHRKPNGQFVITPGMGPAFVEALPVGKFHGIGPATSAKMNAFGLYTGRDMRNQSLEFMQANFGKAGDYYYWVSRGVDNREVRADRIRKSVGAENTFSTDLTKVRGKGPRDDLDAKSSAFGIQFGNRPDDGAPRKIGADAWFDRQGAARFMVREQTVHVTRDETLSLVVLDDKEMLDGP